MRNLLLFCAAFIVIISAAATFAEEPNYVPGEVLVKFKDVLDFSQSPDGKTTQYPSVNRLNDAFNVYSIEPLYDFLPTKPVDDPNGKWTWADWLEVMKKYRYDTYYVIKYKSAAKATEVAAVYRNDANVDIAEPNFTFELEFTPNDTRFWRQWGLHNTGQIPPGGWVDKDIDAPEGWDHWPLTIRQPVVAVLDTGADLDHPDLAANLLPGQNFLNPADPPEDDDGHGTHKCGIISSVSNNTIGVAGIGNNSIRIIPCRVATGDNVYEGAASQAVLWAALHGADVENMSWGKDEDTEILHKAIEGAYDLGIIMCAAAGNYLREMGPHYNYYFYPACYKEVICVSATDYYDRLWDDGPGHGSNYGAEVECASPGKEIYSTTTGNSYYYETGTSSACAFASAICGLIGASITYAPSPPDIVVITRSILYESCDDLGEPGWDQYFGNGRVNLDLTMHNIDGLTEYGRNPNAKTTALKRLKRKASSYTKALASKRNVGVYPNPVKDAAYFVLSVPQNKGVYRISLEVFDISGRKIAAVNISTAEHRDIRIPWVPVDERGCALGAGLYFVRFTVGPDVFTTKMAITK